MLYGMNYYTKDEIDAQHWKFIGELQSDSTNSLVIALPTANPWGIRVIASAECASDTWGDLRAIDANDSYVNFDRSYIENAHGTLWGYSHSSSNEVPFAVLPIKTNRNAVCTAESVRSSTSNWRSFVFHSHSADAIDWSGGSSQRDNTAIKKIELRCGQTGKLYLEVWALYR